MGWLVRTVHGVDEGHGTARLFRCNTLSLPCFSTSQHLDVRTLLSRSGQKIPEDRFALLCLADIRAKPLREHWNVDSNGGSVQTESLLSGVGRVAWNLTSREESFLSDSSFRRTAGVCGTLAWILHGKKNNPNVLPHNNCSQGSDLVTLETADSWICPSSRFLYFPSGRRRRGGVRGAHRWWCHQSSRAGMHTR